MSLSLSLVRCLTSAMVSVHSVSRGVYCSNTVLPIIILMSFRPVTDLSNGLRADVLAVAHDRHVVSKLENLVEPV